MQGESDRKTCVEIALILYFVNKTIHIVSVFISVIKYKMVKWLNLVIFCVSRAYLNTISTHNKIIYLHLFLLFKMLGVVSWLLAIVSC